MPSNRQFLIEKVKGYLEALCDLDENNHRDLDRLMSFLHSDIDYEIPYQEVPIHIRGAAAMRAFLNAGQGLYTNVRIEPVAEYVDVTLSTVVIEAHGERLLLPDLESYKNRYLFVMSLRDGVIASVREYLNPIPAALIAARLTERRA